MRINNLTYEKAKDRFFRRPKYSDGCYVYMKPNGEWYNQENNRLRVHIYIGLDDFIECKKGGGKLAKITLADKRANISKAYKRRGWNDLFAFWNGKDWVYNQGGKVSALVKSKDDFEVYSEGFEDWVDGMIGGAEGHQQGNFEGYFTYIGIVRNEQLFMWHVGGNEVKKYSYSELSEQFINRVKWCVNKTGSSLQGTHRELGRGLKNLEVHHKMLEEPKNEGIEMKDCNVEIKVNGEKVELDKKKVKTPKKIKFYGFWYDAEGDLVDSIGYYSKKEAITEMQKPKNLGNTLELFKRYSTVSTKIPVVEISAD